MSTHYHSLSTFEQQETLYPLIQVQKRIDGPHGYSLLEKVASIQLLQKTLSIFLLNYVYHLVARNKTSSIECIQI